MIKQVLAVSTLICSGWANASWSVNVEEDVVTKETKSRAVSSKVASLEPINKFYPTVESWLEYECDSAAGEMAYARFSMLSDANEFYGYGQKKKIKLKWDNSPEDAIFKYNYDGALTFASEAYALRNFMLHKELLLEVVWFNQAKVHFKYSLEGSTEAINKARQACGMEPVKGDGSKPIIAWQGDTMLDHSSEVGHVSQVGPNQWFLHFTDEGTCVSSSFNSRVEAQHAMEWVYQWGSRNDQYGSRDADVLFFCKQWLEGK